MPASIKVHLVRDSYTMPELEYAQLDALKQRAIQLAQPVKKSELLRAGVAALAAMDDAALLAALQGVPALKTGRPKAEVQPAAAKPSKAPKKAKPVTEAAITKADPVAKPTKAAKPDKVKPKAAKPSTQHTNTTAAVKPLAARKKAVKPSQPAVLSREPHPDTAAPAQMEVAAPSAAAPRSRGSKFKPGKALKDAVS